MCELFVLVAQVELHGQGLGIAPPGRGAGIDRNAEVARLDVSLPAHPNRSDRRLHFDHPPPAGLAAFDTHAVCQSPAGVENGEHNRDAGGRQAKQERRNHPAALAGWSHHDPVLL